MCVYIDGWWLGNAEVMPLIIGSLAKGPTTELQI